MGLLDKIKKEKKEERKQVEKEKISKSKAKEKKEKKTFAPEFIYGYKLIKSPHITEKATDLSSLNKYVFKVSFNANKTEIKKAIEKMYNVKVEKVNIIHIPGKKRRLGRIEGWRKGLKRGFKKAIVSLRKGDKIEVLSR
ncbi:50S ribosomal protein L23 [bacterium]|nr:50S ribosomal protein L23 [bacterium]